MNLDKFTRSSCQKNCTIVSHTVSILHLPWTRMNLTKLPVWAQLGRFCRKAKINRCPKCRRVSSKIVVQQSRTSRISMLLHGHLVRGALPCATHSVEHQRLPKRRALLGAFQVAPPAFRAALSAGILKCSPKKCGTPLREYSLSSSAADTEATMAPSTPQLAWQVCCISPSQPYSCINRRSL